MGKVFRFFADKTKEIFFKYLLLDALRYAKLLVKLPIGVDPIAHPSAAVGGRRGICAEHDVVGDVVSDVEQLKEQILFMVCILFEVF